jgi:hypothetical protein
MNSAENFLIKRGISHAILEDLRKKPEYEPIYRMLSAASFADAGEVRALRSTLKKSSAVQTELGDLLWNEILDELQEIETDLKWSKTSRGKLVLAANRFAEKLYVSLRKHHSFKDVFVGAHAERMAFSVVGFVNDIEYLTSLKKMIADARPDYPVEVNVQVRPRG